MAVKIWNIKCSDLEPLEGIKCDSNITVESDEAQQGKDLSTNIVQPVFLHLAGNHTSAVNDLFRGKSSDDVKTALKGRLTDSYLSSKNSSFKKI